MFWTYVNAENFTILMNIIATPWGETRENRNSLNITKHSSSLSHLWLKQGKDKENENSAENNQTILAKIFTSATSCEKILLT